jgi:hypothetical protein
MANVNRVKMSFIERCIATTSGSKDLKIGWGLFSEEVSD